jgi:hypothetical protein
MTTHSTATIQSTLFGDSKGTSFNDLETGQCHIIPPVSMSYRRTVIGSANVTINTAKPIKEIKIMHGGAVSYTRLHKAFANSFEFPDRRTQGHLL